MFEGHQASRGPAAPEHPRPADRFADDTFVLAGSATPNVTRAVHDPDLHHPGGVSATPGGAAVPDPVTGGLLGGYNIEVVFTSAFDDALVEAFQRAANILWFLVAEDVPDVALLDGTVVDDLRIEAEVVPIDGTGGVLAAAGPSEVRAGDLIPAAGGMIFDEADAQDLLAEGGWDDVVLHEMLHVVGFGTIWDAKGLLQTVEGGLRFVGQNAIQAYEDSFPGIAAGDPLSAKGVPVEEEGGPGTALGHWDEEVFGDELMTGFLGEDNVLSGLTVASLQDLGYATILEQPAEFV